MSLDGHQTSMSGQNKIDYMKYAKDILSLWKYFGQKQRSQSDVWSDVGQGRVDKKRPITLGQDLGRRPNGRGGQPEGDIFLDFKLK